MLCEVRIQVGKLGKVGWSISVRVAWVHEHTIALSKRNFVLPHGSAKLQDSRVRIVFRTTVQVVQSSFFCCGFSLP